MTVTEITDTFDDLNAWDRVYRTESGYTVKIKVQDISTTPALTSLRVTGSWVDDVTAKAKVLDEAYFIVEPHDIVFKTDSPVDIPAAVNEASLKVVQRVELAAINYAARASLGIRPLAEYEPGAPPPVPPLPQE